MKRMKYLAAAGLGPLALGVTQAVPATAVTANHNATQAPTSGKKVIPLTSGKVCDRDVCIEVFGTGNHVSKVTEWITNPTKRPDTFKVEASMANGSHAGNRQRSRCGWRETATPFGLSY